MKKKVLDYLKQLTYNALELLSALVNTLASIFGLYPQLSLGVSFLVMVEAKRVMEELNSRNQRREQLEKEANTKVVLAKEEVGYGEII